MAAPSGKQYGSGFRHARIYELTSGGLLAASATTPYIGLQAVGARAFDITIPQSRRVSHVGDDQLLATTRLPRIEASEATIRVARNDYDLYALISSTLKATIGEALHVGYGTNKQGYEQDVCAMLSQQTIDADTGLTRWRTYIIPVTKLTLNPASLTENANEYTLETTLSGVTKYPWGIAFSNSVEGYTRAEVVEAMTENPVMLTAWEGDGSTLEFDFEASHQAPATGKIHAVTVDGVIATPTLGVDTLTFAVAPADGAIIVAYHEVETL